MGPPQSLLRAVKRTPKPTRTTTPPANQSRRTKNMKLRKDSWHRCSSQPLPPWNPYLWLPRTARCTTPTFSHCPNRSTPLSPPDMTAHTTVPPRTTRMIAPRLPSLSTIWARLRALPPKSPGQLPCLYIRQSTSSIHGYHRSTTAAATIQTMPPLRCLTRFLWLRRRVYLTPLTDWGLLTWTQWARKPLPTTLHLIPLTWSLRTTLVLFDFNSLWMLLGFETEHMLGDLWRVQRELQWLGNFLFSIFSFCDTFPCPSEGIAWIFSYPLSILVFRLNVSFFFS